MTGRERFAAFERPEKLPTLTLVGVAEDPLSHS